MTLLLARKLKEFGFSHFISENIQFLTQNTVNQLELANTLCVDSHQVAVMMSHVDIPSQNQTLYEIIRVATEPTDFIIALQFTGNEHIVQFIEIMMGMTKTEMDESQSELEMNFILEQLQKDSKYKGEAQGLIQILRGNPIALRRIAALFQSQNHDLKTFLDELESVIKLGLEHRNPNNPNPAKFPMLTAIHFASIRLTLRTFQNLPLALEVIEFLAFYHPCGIPIKYLHLLFNTSPGDNFSEQKVGECIHLLEKYSLVRFSDSDSDSDSKNSERLHGQLSTLDSLSTVTLRPFATTYVMEHYLPGQSITRKNTVLENLARRSKDVLSGIRLHLAKPESPRILMSSWSLYDHHVKHQPYNVVFMDFEFELSNVFLAAGQYSKALELCTHVHEGHRVNLGETNVQTLDAELQMAIILSHQDLFDEAFRLFKDVETKFVNLLGTNHPKVLTTRYQQAYIHFKRKELGEAEEILNAVWTQRKSILGETHEDTMITECLFGLVWNSKGQQDQAREIWTKVLNKRTKIYGETHPATLRIKFNMAGVLTETEDDSGAAEFYRRIAEGQMKTLGESHPETLNTLHDYGVTLGNDGRLEEAISCFKDICDKKRVILGENHPSTIKTEKYLESLLNLKSMSMDF